METNTVEPGATAKCAECGGVFPTDEMIRHGIIHVCARCKPVFMQKLAEGASIRMGLRFAGFWRRFGAVVLDALLLWVVNTVVQLIVIGTFVQTVEADQFSLWSIALVYIIGFATGACYEAGLVAKYGATFGKMACNVKVVAPDGGPISFGRALGRHFAKYLSSIILCIGYIIAAFDEEGRTLHDHLCNTRVVMT
jgi:uncharacterized RDD family membrane protein YckC